MLRLTTLLLPLLLAIGMPVASLAQQRTTGGALGDEDAHLSTIRRPPPGPHGVGFASYRKAVQLGESSNHTRLSSFRENVERAEQLLREASSSPQY